MRRRGRTDRGEMRGRGRTESREMSGRGRIGSREMGLSGVMTVELAYLIPVILLVLELIIYAVFYYHDKNILIGAAGETAVTVAQYERKPGGKETVDWETFLQAQIQGKLILFAEIEAEVTRTDEEIEVTAFAKKGFMRLEVLQRAIVSMPEKDIRRMQIVKDRMADEE